jgi:pimeloyl-ACP methyl ester carboxylesterase
MKIIKAILKLLLFLVIVVALIIVFFPKFILEAFYSFNLKGKPFLRNNVTLADGQRVDYLIGGADLNSTGKTLVYVAGLPDAKELSAGLDYLKLVAISKQKTVIILELPGVGKTQNLVNKKYSLQNIADYINNVLNSIPVIGDVTIAGFSTGGGAVMSFASRQDLYLDKTYKLEKFLAIQPFIGVATEKSQAKKLFEEGKNVVAPETTSEVAIFEGMAYNKPKSDVPFPLAVIASRYFKKNKSIFDQHLKDIYESLPLASTELKNIKVNGKLTIAENDQYIDKSRLADLIQNLPVSTEIVLINEGAHAGNFSKPQFQDLKQEIYEFMKS